MNRMEEYDALLTELDNIPPALEYTFPRAEARVTRSKRLRRCFAIPLSSLVASFIIFIMMVNASTGFAYACGRIPLLRELAVAVALSPSLSAAVDNEYVQPMDMEQSENGITMRVEYVIVDQKRLDIFYTLNSKSYNNMDAVPSIANPDGTALEGYSISSSSVTPNGELAHITVDFVERDMPDSLLFTCKVRDLGSGAATWPAHSEDAPVAQPEYAEPQFISSFAFTLQFDPAFTQQGETIELNQTFRLDGQTLTATTVEVYPTHVRLNLKDHENNTAWLKSLSYYLENEKGQRFEALSNGVTGVGSADSPMMVSHWLESSFFAGSKSLTLTITGAVWLDKDMERIRVDLASGTADALPEGVKLEEAVRTGDDWQLAFSGLLREEGMVYQLFGTDYYDEAGNEYSYNSWSQRTSGYWDEKSNQYVDIPSRFQLQFTLAGYPYEAVFLSPSFSRVAALDTPVVIKVK